jgi:hypothetical protein
VTKRRKRSHMSRNDCLLAFESFAKLVQRQAESSGGLTFGECPDGQIDVKFRVLGSFGVAEAVFEAVRVLAGHKLPAQQCGDERSEK